MVEWSTCPSLPGTFSVLALKILHPRKAPQSQANQKGWSPLLFVIYPKHPLLWLNPFRFQRNASPHNFCHTFSKQWMTTSKSLGGLLVVLLILLIDIMNYGQKYLDKKKGTFIQLVRPFPSDIINIMDTWNYFIAFQLCQAPTFLLLFVFQFKV